MEYRYRLRESVEVLKAQLCLRERLPKESKQWNTRRFTASLRNRYTKLKIKTLILDLKCRDSKHMCDMEFHGRAKCVKIHTCMKQRVQSNAT